TITVRPPSGPMTKLRVIFDSGLESALATGNKAILHNWTLPGPEVSLVAANKKPMSVHGTGTAILRLPDQTEVSVQGALLCNEIAEDLIYIGLPTMAILSRLLGNKGGGDLLPSRRVDPSSRIAPEHHLRRRAYEVHGADDGVSTQYQDRRPATYDPTDPPTDNARVAPKVPNGRANTTPPEPRRTTVSTRPTG
ncbi:MAG: hypothetical protein ACK55I_29435, partial [bacterium]